MKVKDLFVQCDIWVLLFFFIKTGLINGLSKEEKTETEASGETEAGVYL